MTLARASRLPPPSIEARQAERIVHGRRLEDPYAWLRADNWREVLRDPAALPPAIREVLEAENTYSAVHLDALAGVRETLVAEMRGRIQEDDASVPVADGGWLYYQRYRPGGQLPLYCRRRDGGDEEVLVDGDREREGHAFFTIGEVTPSPDHARIAWSADAQGSEYFTIRVREDGADRGETFADSDGTIVWMAGGQGFYYVRVDESHRTGEVYRHRLDGSPDVVVFAEVDPAWFVGLTRTESGRFAVLRVSDHASSECHLLQHADGDAVPFCVEPRAPMLKAPRISGSSALRSRRPAARTGRRWCRIAGAA